MQALTTTSIRRHRRARAHRILVSVLALVAFALPSATGLTLASTDGPQGSAVTLVQPAVSDYDRQITSLSPERHRVAVTQLVNAERTKRGLKPLLPSQQLVSSARSWALVTVRGFGELSHGDFGRRAQRFPFVVAQPSWHRTVGENLAFGTGEYSTPRQIVASWMTSPGHRANLLRNWTYGAVWSTRSGDGVAVVHHFGRNNLR